MRKREKPYLTRAGDSGKMAGSVNARKPSTKIPSEISSDYGGMSTTDYGGMSTTDYGGKILSPPEQRGLTFFHLVCRL